MSNFTSILELIEENHGGVKFVELIDIQEILTFPDCQGSNIEEDIILKDGASTFVLNFTRETPSFDEQDKNVGPNLYAYSSKLSGVIPKAEQYKLAQLRKMALTRFVVLFTDNNGFRRVMGSKEEPCFLNWASKTEKNYDQRNQYDLVFTLDGRFPVPFIADGIGFVLPNLDKLYEDGDIFAFEDGITYRFE